MLTVGVRSSVNHAQRPCLVDAPLPVVRVYAGLTKVVRCLENPGPDQRGVAATQLCHEQGREPGDVRGREAVTDGLRDCLTG